MTSIEKFLTKLSNILCLVLKLKEVECKPSVSKFTESVVGDLSTKFIDAEVQIGLENERKEALESEVNVLKRKQEALGLTCQEKMYN